MRLVKLMHTPVLVDGENLVSFSPPAPVWLNPEHVVKVYQRSGFVAVRCIEELTIYSEEPIEEVLECLLTTSAATPDTRQA